MNSRKTKTVKKRHGQKLKEVEKWIKNDKVCKIVKIARRIEWTTKNGKKSNVFFFVKFLN